MEVSSVKTYFISGPIDVSQEEFEKHYVERIQRAIEESAAFVVGDANGADSLAQKYLFAHCDSSKVTVFHLYEKPMNNFGNFKTRGGFMNHSSKDSMMTWMSNEDILWIRPEEDQKKLLGDKYKPGFVTGTMRNQRRRVEYNKSQEKLKQSK